MLNFHVKSSLFPLSHCECNYLQWNTKNWFVNDLSMVRDYTFLGIHIARRRASSHKEAVYIIFKYKIYEIVS